MLMHWQQSIILIQEPARLLNLLRCAEPRLLATIQGSRRVFTLIGNNIDTAELFSFNLRVDWRMQFNSNYNAGTVVHLTPVYKDLTVCKKCMTWEVLKIKPCK